ncbi:Plasmodium variant antigen protein Cir/Yir/Bir, putative, partial [Plasmodium chabaudi chabaudi]
MEQSSCSIEDVYKEFNNIDGEFGVRMQGESSGEFADQSIHDYCHYGNPPEKGKCHNYFQMASSGVIRLLTKLKEKCNLEYDKLAEYAILFLNYKLNQSKKNTFKNLNEFYTSYIETNNYYNEKIKDDDTTTYKKIIDRKKDLMNIKEISKFNDPFGILLLLYLVIKNKKLDCTEYSSYPKDFADKFKDLNNDSNNKENSSYNKLLSTLSNDYNNLKNMDDDKNKCSNFPSFPELTPQKFSIENSVKVSGQTLEKTPEGTLSSSSILNTVISVLSTFFVISLFLGVSYKYSLFGFGKRSQKRYLRENI